jgi:hypothetical protein
MAPVGTGDERGEGWSRGMNITRHQIEFCFKQATQGERFSQEYCVDRILELVNANSTAASGAPSSEAGARLKADVAVGIGLAIYARMTALAHQGNQVVGEKSDYYVTLEQLESAFVALRDEIGGNDGI